MRCIDCKEVFEEAGECVCCDGAGDHDCGVCSNCEDGKVCPECGSADILQI